MDPREYTTPREKERDKQRSSTNVVGHAGSSPGSRRLKSRVDMKFRSESQIIECKRLAAWFCSIPEVKQRAEELCGNLKTLHRGCLVLDKLPRVHVDDFGPNYPILLAAIELDEDEKLKDVELIWGMMHFVDKEYNPPRPLASGRVDAREGPQNSVNK